MINFFLRNIFDIIMLKMLEGKVSADGALSEIF